MKILFIGDTYGRSGRQALITELPMLIKNKKIDFVAINGENVTNGKSLDEKHYNLLSAIGVDCFTMGNHTFYGGKLEKYLAKVNNILVPHNYNAFNKYNGSQEFIVKGKTVRITSLLGQVFMMPIPSNPFQTMEEILQISSSDIHIVDFHGEATAEKIGFAYYFDGRFTTQVGSHTHVQTNDAKILPKGTGFLTDLGMTGPVDSIIGAEIKPVIAKLATGMPHRFFPATGRYQLMGCIIHIDDKTNQTTKMELVNIVQDEN